MSSAGSRSRSLPMSVTGGTRTTYTRSPGEIARKEAFKRGQVIYLSDSLIGTGTQITESESHPYDRKHGRWVGGGPFYTDKLEYEGGKSSARLLVPGTSLGQFRQYDGPLYYKAPTSSEMTSWFGRQLGSARSQDTSDLDPDGAVAISICSPVNPAAQLGVGLSETYREGLPSLPGIASWKRRTEAAKAAGSEFLNTEFGWLPLIGEVNSVVNAARNHRDILEQYHRDEGKNVRRTYGFPNEVTTTYRSIGERTPLVTGSEQIYGLGKWAFSAVLSKTVRKWFVGSFTYGTPSQTDSWRRALGFGSEADKLYGLALSPTILWELTPWSWAVDWFTNAGHVINNVTNFELAGQIMRYGYMMEESIDEVTVTGQYKGGAFENPEYTSIQVPATVSTSVRRVSKVRRPANPYGFGLTYDGLSPTQVLIAAALGITLA